MKKVAIGCGIAALIFIAIGIGATVLGVRWMNHQVADAERYETVTNQMVAEYGEAEAWAPPVDGNYDPARVALFAELRTRVHGAGDHLRDEAADMATGQNKNWLKGLRSMMRILNAGMGYLADADSTLMDAGMSRGEYAHLQAMWLHAGSAGWPEDFTPGPTGRGAHESFLKVFEDLAEGYEDETRTLLKAHARNARDAADDAGPECESCPAWLEYLDDQLEASRTSRSYVPLLDPLPESLALAFDQYEYELRTTRPNDYGTWLMAILMVMELDDDGQGINIQIGE
jgi:hypothetical protein